jgi:hypothetical protein
MTPCHKNGDILDCVCNINQSGNFCSQKQIQMCKLRLTAEQLPLQLQLSFKCLCLSQNLRQRAGG